MSKNDVMLKQEVLQRVKGLRGGIRKSTICALIGHSRITEFFFGYHNCARCGAQLGDSLASTYDSSNNVILGHDCKECQENIKTLTWRDTLNAPNPL